MIGIEKNTPNINPKSREGSIAESDISQPIKIRKAMEEMNQIAAKNSFLGFLVDILPEHSGHASQESEMGSPHL
tara:strand:+ start:340 stop:561 length:222 start_codon:yes stop_codon:yes gene_type:complete